MKRLALAVGVLSLACVAVAGQRICLWPDGNMPCRRQVGEWSSTTRKDGVVMERNVSEPTLEFFPAAGNGTGPCVIICPGGGYEFLAVNKEGSEIAAWLNGIGYSAFVLRYRVPGNPDGAFADAVRALEIVRERAAQFRIDPYRVGMIGFSAGANLTARASTWGPRPDFALVIYPWYLVPDPSAGEHHPSVLRGVFGINTMTPPTFIVQSADDRYGVENARAWAEALKQAGVSHELHVFADGGHGYGIRKTGNSPDGWEKLAEAWLKGLTPKRDILRLRYNNPAVRPYLKVGLWAWPMAMDYDGDGDLDLVVACGDTPYGGTHFFENVGGGAMPTFRKSIRIAEGKGNVARATSSRKGCEDVCVPGVSLPDFLTSGYGAAKPFADLPANVHSNNVRGNVWRTVDFDGDGRQDVLVGVGDWSRYGIVWKGAKENYAKDGTWLTPPVDGFVYWCRGTDTGYDKAELVRLADGRPLWTNGNPMPMCEDWDGDGDLDILCGEFVDGFTYFENVGTRTAPRYAAGRRLKGPGGGGLQMELAMITPSAVDWDGDGRLDIICGDEDGRVALIRNTGAMRDGLPCFEEPKYFRQEADDLNFGCLSTPCGVDWDGDGDWDLVCGDSAGHIAFIENLSGPNVPEPKWAEPVRLKAGGKEIRIMAGENGSIQGPIERKWGYTCLTAADWDGDGLPDIMANSITGDVVWFRNVGTRTKPELAPAEDVEVEWNGPQPEMPFGWYQPKHKRNPKGLLTQWRTTPVMFDWNGDGLMDLVMLDKEGYLALCRRARRNGRLVLLPPARVFADAKGGLLRPAAKSHGASGRRKLALVDWDGDGKTDLVMNSRNAEVWLNQGVVDGLTRFRRIGHVAEYRLAGHSSSPTVVDFDGDGVMDIVIGAEDGFFYHVRNPRRKAAAANAKASSDDRLVTTMRTEWGEKVTPENVWRDYPRPQMVRDGWTCLNGLWDYTIVSNVELKAVEVAKGKILVPFAFESALSGVGRKIEPHEKMIYRRNVEIAPEKGKRILLNFEAVDWRAQVFVNGVEATDVPHEGGSLPFGVDITDFVRPGENEIKVVAWDPTHTFVNAGGKQNDRTVGCWYTRVSGIWQTVWMEQVPEEHVVGFRVVSDVDGNAVSVTVDTNRAKSVPARVNVLWDGKTVAAGVAGTSIAMPSDVRLWSPDSPSLYDLEISFGADRVRGYFAMRKVDRALDARGEWRFRLNNEFVFPIGTLDQGWWPDGLLTPPSSAACAHEIRTLKACGFNMMRKHIKVEPRVYYALCDRMGLMVFQDAPSPAGRDNTRNEVKNLQRYGMFRREWKEQIDHLFNVPSIVMWIPYNETWGQPDESYTADTLRWTRRYDGTRLVGGPSGWNDFEGGDAYDYPKGTRKIARDPWGRESENPSCDTVDCHIYPGPGQCRRHAHRISMLGEFGGLGLKVPGHLWNEAGSWGYADTGKVVDRLENQRHYLSLMEGVKGLVREGLAAAVYTQTSDVELEINGLMTYDRKVLKYDAAVLKAAHEGIRAEAKEAAGRAKGN